MFICEIVVHRAPDGDASMSQSIEFPSVGLSEFSLGYCRCTYAPNLIEASSDLYDF